MTAVTTPATARVLDLGGVAAGSIVEARRKGEVHYRGCVEDAAPSLGIIWIRDDMAGHRAILHLDEYSIWQIGA